MEKNTAAPVIAASVATGAAAPSSDKGDRIQEVIRQRDLLADAIGKAAIKCGIYRPELEGMTGPQLLMAVDDMAECILSHADKQANFDHGQHGYAVPSLAGIDLLRLARIVATFAMDKGDAEMRARCIRLLELIYSGPKPEADRRDVRNEIAGLEGSVAVGSDGEWVSIRRSARDAAVVALRNVSADCAHIYHAFAAASDRAAAVAASELAAATPRIDLTELRSIASDLSHTAKVGDYEPQQIEFIESVRDRLLVLINARPAPTAPATDEQYADADALIAHLDGLMDDGGLGGEKWEPAQAAIAGIRAWKAGTPRAWMLFLDEATIGMCIAGDAARVNKSDLTRAPAIWRAMVRHARVHGHHLDAEFLTQFEPAGWQWSYLDTDDQWSKWIDGGTRQEINDRVKRWKADGEAHRLRIRAVYASPEHAARDAARFHEIARRFDGSSTGTSERILEDLGLDPEMAHKLLAECVDAGMPGPEGPG